MRSRFALPPPRPLAGVPSLHSLRQPGHSVPLRFATASTPLLEGTPAKGRPLPDLSGRGLKELALSRAKGQFQGARKLPSGRSRARSVRSARFARCTSLEPSACAACPCLRTVRRCASQPPSLAYRLRGDPLGQGKGVLRTPLSFAIQSPRAISVSAPGW